MASPRPPIYVKKDKTPALGAPTTKDRRLDQFLQNIHERIERLNDADTAAQITSLRTRLENVEGGSGNNGSGTADALVYKGEWDASAGDFPSSDPAMGDYYVVATSGTTDLNGITDWELNDWAVYNGNEWDIVRNRAIVAGDNITVETASGVTTITSTASGTAEATPTYIPVGSTTTVATNSQMLYVLPITVDGTLTVNGHLVEVGV